MISVDTSQIRRLERDLQRFSRSVLPKANRSALSAIAFDASKTAKKDLPNYMILRAPGNYTRKSIRYEKAQGARISAQSSRVGSTLEYMRDQEFGAVRRARRGASALSIVTPSASGESSYPTRRMPRAANTLRRIDAANRGDRRRRSRKAQLFADVSKAIATGNRFIVTERPGGKMGLTKVVGGRRGSRARDPNGWPRGAKLKLMYDLSHKRVTIPATHWLEKSVRKTRSRAPGIYLDSLQFRARQAGLLR